MAEPPPGGGAVRSIGEAFTTNVATGTGSMAIPIATSAGRAGLGPALALAYDSGSGNGPFGIGWALSVPAITRATDRGVPLYRDEPGGDRFLLAGAELVVALGADGRPQEDERDGHLVRTYRPRVDTGGILVEWWRRPGAPADSHWRTRSGDGVSSRYGTTPTSRIADPDDPTRVASWLLASTATDIGNALVHEYAAEDDAGVDVTAPGEGGRTRTAGRYLARVRYGNRSPCLDADGRLTDPEGQPADGWLFEVVLDHGEGLLSEHPDGEDTAIAVTATPTPVDGARWVARPDPFSTHRTGFEVRTHRLCRSVLVFHRFPELGAEPVLTGATTFHYDEDPTGARLRRVVASGFVAEPGIPGSYRGRSLPPLDLRWSTAPTDDELRARPVQALRDDQREALPAGTADRRVHWVDLHGDGAAGVVIEADGSWWHRPNLGPTTIGTPGGVEARFGPTVELPVRPAVRLDDRRAQLVDLDGDGVLEAVVETPRPGRHRREGGTWGPFEPFARWPLPPPRQGGPHLLVDLDGDGVADLLTEQGGRLLWCRSLGAVGFADPIEVPFPTEGPDGPPLRTILGDPTLRFADLTGDGLADLVRVGNARISYWPNRGHGRFGPQVEMADAPVFDHPDRFSVARVVLADVDGSGTADALYVGTDGVVLHRNRSGNGWSDGVVVGSAAGDPAASVDVVDVIGDGTLCVTWSSPSPLEPLRYLRLLDGKPGLLVGTANNLGAETVVEYAPSTVFALRDRSEGRPWPTGLPFPVHLVERVHRLDHLRGSRTTTTYAYHDGHFDPGERTFAGFGRVEQWDLDVLGGTRPAGPNARRPAPEPAGGPRDHHDPTYARDPVRTCTWFHTGAEGTETEGLPDRLDGTDRADAWRARRGTVRRYEIYAEDGGPRSDRPYLVSTESTTVELLQRRGPNAHAVFAVRDRERITTHSERGDDPRIVHTAVVATDRFGTPLRRVQISYPRASRGAADRREQREVHIGLDAVRVGHHTDDPARRRIGLLLDSWTFEVVSPPAPAEADGRIVPYRYDELVALVGALLPPDADRPPADRRWPVERWDWRTAADRPPTPRLRPTGHTTVRYRTTDLARVLGPGESDPAGIVHETYDLVATPGLLADALGDLVDLDELAEVLASRDPDGGGLVAIDDGWYAPSGRSGFHPDADLDDVGATAAVELAEARAHFFVLRRSVDAFGHPTRLGYDDHDLLRTTVEDAAGMTSRVDHDYRVLGPVLVTEPNGNRVALAHDALGLVVATAVAGRPGEPVGDTLVGVVTDPAVADLQAFAADPRGQARGLLAGATTRIVHDLDRYRRCGQPGVTATLSRTVRTGEPGAEHGPVLVSLSFRAGQGQALQTKVPAEDGVAPQRHPVTVTAGGDVLPGALARDAAGRPVLAKTTDRWVGTGRAVIDAKGRPIRRFEPFFSSTPLFETDAELVETGTSTVAFYDPVGRPVASLHPDGTYSKVLAGPWEETAHDRSDTATSDPRLDPDLPPAVTRHLAGIPGWKTWYQQRIDRPVGDPERRAAEAMEVCAGTPGTVRFDAAGRPFEVHEPNRFARDGALVEEPRTTTSVLDGTGDQRALIDAGGRVAATYAYDLLGQQLAVASADASRAWTVLDALGRPIRTGDDRGRRTRLCYDALGRPTDRYELVAPGREVLAARTVYGDDPESGWTRAEAAARGLLGRPWAIHDEAGVVVNGVEDPATGEVVAYDLVGNLLGSQRRLVRGLDPPDWSGPAPELDEPMVVRWTYDATNEVRSTTAPDGTEVTLAHDDAHLVERVLLRTPDGDEVASVTGVDHDARGRRTSVRLANGVTTTRGYDPASGALVHLRTVRRPDGDRLASGLFVDPGVVQDLTITRGPDGRVIEDVDTAIAVRFHANQRVEARRRFTYDAGGRLRVAEGREHIGQTAVGAGAPRDRPFVGGSAGPDDTLALRRYVQHYAYDVVDNITELRHRADGASWTQVHLHAEPSRIDPTVPANRLTSTTLAGTEHRYRYDDPAGADAGGAITAVDGVALGWDHRGMLVSADLGGGGVVRYAYDHGGARVRKVVVRGGSRTERVDAGGFERVRRYRGDTLDEERTTVHLEVGDLTVALIETTTVLDGQVLARPVRTVRYQVVDALGTPTVELDEHGSVVTYEEHHPFGTTSFQAARSVAEGSLKRYRFTGREREEETGFAHHGARAYVPWLGRWLSPDPIGLGAGANVFAYVGNRPTAATDPSGLAPQAPAPPRYFKVNGVYEREDGMVRMEPIDSAMDVYVYNPATYEHEPAGLVMPEDNITVKGPMATSMHSAADEQAAIDKVKEDIGTMDAAEFDRTYGTDDRTRDEWRKTLFPPLALDDGEQITIGNDGRVGKTIDIEDSDLADRIEHMQPATMTGTAFGIAGLAISGGDVHKAVRWMDVGNQLDGVLGAVLFLGAGANRLSQGTPSIPPRPPPGGGGGSGGGGSRGGGYQEDGRFHLSFVNHAQTRQIDPQTAFQGLTINVAGKLNANRSLVPRYLHQSQLHWRWSSNVPFQMRIAFGWSVEGAVFDAAAPTGLLERTGHIPPMTRGMPDGIGRPGTPYEGLLFQVTTVRAWPAHVERDAPGTIYGLYLTFEP